MWLVACGSKLDEPKKTSDLPHFISPEAVNDFSEIEIPVSKGDTARARIWSSALGLPEQRNGIIFVSGVDGGFVEPVDGIYDRTAKAFAQEGVSSIMVEYRYPGELESSIQDTVAAASHLRKLGVTHMALVGWSFGGAVIIHSALEIPEVVTLIGFAAQSKDTEVISAFSRQSILLFHSVLDDNVPFESAEEILNTGPIGLQKLLCSLDDADHFLSGAAAKIDPVVQNWLRSKLLNRGSNSERQLCI